MIICVHLFARPHIVTVQWLLDSFSRGSVLPVESYFHPSFLPPAPTHVDIPAPCPAASLPFRKSFAAPPAPSPNRHARAEEELLSQYVDNNQTVGEFCVLVWPPVEGACIHVHKKKSGWECIGVCLNYINVNINVRYAISPVVSKQTHQLVYSGAHFHTYCLPADFGLGLVLGSWVLCYCPSGVLFLIDLNSNCGLLRYPWEQERRPFNTRQ